MCIVLFGHPVLKMVKIFDCLSLIVNTRWLSVLRAGRGRKEFFISEKVKVLSIFLVQSPVFLMSSNIVQIVAIFSIVYLV